MKNKLIDIVDIAEMAAYVMIIIMLCVGLTYFVMSM